MMRFDRCRQADYIESISFIETVRRERVLRFESRKRGSLSRREWLRIGGWGGLASVLPFLKQASAAESPSEPSIGFGKAKSVLVVFASGGQSQFETWDPKPSAPREIRGAFDAIPTSVPGTFVSEHMPRIAQLADRFTIVRSMSHEDLDHGTAFYLSMTGRYHIRRSANPPPMPTDYPTHAAVLKRVRPTDQFVHTGVHVNGPAVVPTILGPGQFGGFLGRDFDPMIVGNVVEKPIVMPGLSQPVEVPAVRLDGRRSLLSSLEEQTRRFRDNQEMLDMSMLYRQAFEMLDEPRTRNAFNLSAESDALRDRYGRNRSGQACLLARRLVEAGVPLVTVFFNHCNRGQDKNPDDTDEYGWDTHNDIFESLKDRLLPRFDLGFSALIEDLDERGLLEDTLVICMGEFGRAPLVALEPRFAGATPGRKHWASVYSIVMAGAGVGRGKVVGRSDRSGAHPASEKYGPWDVQATMFSALGIDPTAHYADATGRPFPISIGRPIEALYAG